MFDPLQESNRSVVKPGRRPGTKQFFHGSTQGMLRHDDEDSMACSSTCGSVARSDRFESSQRHRGSGDILSHSDAPRPEASALRVGRKPLQQPAEQEGAAGVAATPREREFGNMCLPDVQNSERFEHSQRNRTAGDILGHRDDHLVDQPKQRTLKQRVSGVDGATQESVQEELEKLRVGRARTEKPQAIADAETSVPFATAYGTIFFLRKTIMIWLFCGFLGGVCRRGFESERCGCKSLLFFKKEDAHNPFTQRTGRRRRRNLLSGRPATRTTTTTLRACSRAER